MLSNTTNQLKVVAKLWYRKANPEFLNAVYGVDHQMKAPATLMTQQQVIIEILADE